MYLEFQIVYLEFQIHGGSRVSLWQLSNLYRRYHGVTLIIYIHNWIAENAVINCSIYECCMYLHYKIKQFHNTSTSRKVHICRKSREVQANNARC